ncbi:TetR/AcrR family transcriptional regulator [Thalassolituus sp.]|jgi:AcrR family transcriptional regulator|uniref:TetR/AcrR family transcriptional regulator n=1 Tax=Thalassolituus sp. TaxID=2030822 RepID=UPI002EAB77D4|nr:TetR/AcrR family transcriptional regulator [Pseudomonadota bacterium]MEC8102159.1 TetR/AcrR family transcriptional regulator [Pseudomonadota bacterium]MEC8525140.1 TetR/AcrR family transcriptional regulator [Pseudomonadota bacterium]
MTAAATDHKERLLSALERILSTKSYRDVTLSDITAGAKVSRRSFYENFSNKDDCLLALARITSQRIMESILHAHSPGDSWVDTVSKVTRGYLEFIGSHPTLMYALYVEVAALGQEGLLLRRDIGQLFARFLSLQTQLRRKNEEIQHELSEHAALALVAGINELILQVFVESDSGSLSEELNKQLPEIGEVAQSLILRMTGSAE